MTAYLPSLDGLRFLAVLLVYLHHHPWMSGPGPWSFLQREGWLGVDVFLALSAFLFARLLSLEHEATGRIDARRFYVRRILRIAPAYVCYLTLAVVAQCALEGPSSVPLLRLATLATFTDNLATAVQGYNPIFETAHLWTIAYELQFYLILPVGVAIFTSLPSRLRAPFVAGLLVLGSALKGWTILHGPGQPAVWVLPWTHFESVALGALLGLGRLDGLLGRVAPRSLALLAGASFAVLCLLPEDTRSSPWLFPKYLVSGLVAILAIRVATAWPAARALFGSRWLVHLGKRSYGLYLFHGMAIVASDLVLRQAFGQERFGLASLLLGMPCAWLAAYISYRWLESPFLRWKRRFETVPSRPI